MTIATIIAVLAIAIVGLFFHLRRKVRHLRASYALDIEVHKIICDFTTTHPGFWAEQDYTFDYSGIELEFCKLPAYRLAFARYNLSLIEASPELQAAGYSHVIFYPANGNSIPVSNFVDITEQTVRLA